MKYRKCTTEETQQIKMMIEATDGLSAKVAAIGYDVLKRLYQEYIDNFKPSLFRWVPLDESKFYYSFTGYKGRPVLVGTDKEKEISSRIRLWPGEPKYLNKKFRTNLTMQDCHIINQASDQVCTSSDFEKWKSRVVLWGLEPYEFTTEEDLNYYDRLLDEHKTMTGIVALYPDVECTVK